MKLTELICKYKHIALYGIFGFLTTVVNIATYWLMAHIFHLGIMPSTLIAWVVAVFFAYLTNRKWVFHSQTNGIVNIIKELSYFFMCRIATGVVDWACMYIFVDIFYINDVIIKTAANVLVIILNYIASKFVIFKTNR
ncbi:MAG: GtrA family protein [Ruminococcaceae bacterium]|nr:GtrA family protein [Oscillospiraceae bacterium]